MAVMCLGNPVAAQDCGCEGGGVVSGHGHHSGMGIGGHVQQKLNRFVGSGFNGSSGVLDADGMTQPVDTITATKPLDTLKFAAFDHFSPNRLYAYSQHGIEAGWTHKWNQDKMNEYPWHGGNSYWRFGTPTALVVPPTAGFHTTYRWGVGQTTSYPIYHQFGRNGAGMIGGGGGGGFSAAPYWPSSTNQHGVYPVRGPWN